MSTKMELVNEEIVTGNKELEAIFLEEPALRKRSSTIRHNLHTLWVEKHVKLSREFPLNYEEDQADLIDLVAFAKESGTGGTILQDWTRSFNGAPYQSLAIHWDRYPQMPKDDKMPVPYIFLTDFYGEVDYNAKTEAASRLARAINIDGQSRFLIAMKNARGSQIHQEYMVSGENYDQWRVALGCYEMDDPYLIPAPSSSLPTLLKELYENS